MKWINFSKCNLSKLTQKFLKSEPGPYLLSSWIYQQNQKKSPDSYDLN